MLFRSGSACAVLEKGDAGVKIEGITTGKIIDNGINDANNMGAAMAPAALSTIKAHFEDMGRSAKDYELIVTGDLGQFNRDYLRLTRQVAESCTDHDLSEDSMVIGTSALAQYEIDGAVGMYSGIFNNPFLIWGKHKRQWWKTTLTLSFQFHHTQMDGAHAARFLSLIQEEIDTITING